MPPTAFLVSSGRPGGNDIITVEIEGVRPLKVLIMSGNITLIALGLTQEDQVWIEIIDKAEKVETVSTPTFNVPC